MSDTISEIDQMKQHGCPNGIWWLASYPKSGSTWVRMFLNCAVTRFPLNINAAFQYVWGDLLGSVYQTCSAMSREQMGVREAIYLRPASLISHLALNGQRDCCLKTHHANVYVDEIPMIPAKLSRGALYIVRDPRDVCVSFAQHVGRDMDATIDLMRRTGCCIHKDGSALFHYLTTWSSHVRSWLSQDNPIPTSMLRYEDLLDDPYSGFRHVCDVLGLSHHVDDEALAFGIDQTQLANLKRQEETHGFRESGGKQKRFFNAGRSGGWRNVLTEEQVRRIEADHGEVMVELGYSLSGGMNDGSEHERVEDSRESCAQRRG